MADFSVEQKKIIDNYRFNNGLSSALSYDAVVSIMEKNGDTITLKELNDAKETSLFGFGYESEFSVGDNADFSATRKTKENKTEKFNKARETVSKKTAGTNVYKNTFEAMKELGWNDKTEDADKLTERLAEISPELYENSEIGKLIIEKLIQNDIPVSFDNVADILDTEGISIRTEEEQLLKQKHTEEISIKEFTKNLLSYMYSSVSEMYAQAEDNLTPIVDIGFWANMLNKLVTKVTDKHLDYKSSSKYFADKAEEIDKMSSLNDAEFKKQFKEYFGIEYDEQLIKENIEILKNPDDERFNEVYKKVFGSNIQKNVNRELTINNISSGLGDIGVMLGSLGLAGGIKAVQAANMAAVRTTAELGSKVAMKGSAKFAHKMSKFAGKCIQLSGGAVVGGTQLGGFELAKGTLGNIFSAKDLEDLTNGEVEVLHNALSSYGFGFFGGIWGQTAVKGVQNIVNNTSKRVMSELSPKFAEGSVKLSDIVSTFVEKSAPTVGAKAAGFVTEVTGFTMYETALTILQQRKDFPENMTVEDVADILWEQFKGQGMGLGQVKLVSSLIMFMSGGKIAQTNAMNYLSQAKEFEGIKVRQITEDNETKFIVESDKFKLECKSFDEVITSGVFLTRMNDLAGKVETTESGVKVAEEIQQTDINGEAEAKAKEAVKSQTGVHNITTQTISPNEVAEFLRENGFTDKEIEEFDLNDEFTQNTVMYCKSISKLCGLNSLKELYEVKSIKEAILTFKSYARPEDVKSAKYVTNENYNELKKYIDTSKLKPNQELELTCFVEPTMLEGIKKYREILGHDLTMDEVYFCTGCIDKSGILHENALKLSEYPHAIEDCKDKDGNFDDSMLDFTYELLKNNSSKNLRSVPREILNVCKDQDGHFIKENGDLILNYCKLADIQLITDSIKFSNGKIDEAVLKLLYAKKDKHITGIFGCLQETTDNGKDITNPDAVELYFKWLDLSNNDSYEFEELAGICKNKEGRFNKNSVEFAGKLLDITTKKLKEEADANTKSCSVLIRRIIMRSQTDTGELNPIIAEAVLDAMAKVPESLSAKDMLECIKDGLGVCISEVGFKKSAFEKVISIIYDNPHALHDITYTLGDNGTDLVCEKAADLYNALSANGWDCKSDDFTLNGFKISGREFDEAKLEAAIQLADINIGNTGELSRFAAACVEDNKVNTEKIQKIRLLKTSKLSGLKEFVQNYADEDGDINTSQLMTDVNELGFSWKFAQYVAIATGTPESIKYAEILEANGYSHHSIVDLVDNFEHCARNLFPKTILTDSNCEDINKLASLHIDQEKFEKVIYRCMNNEPGSETLFSSEKLKIAYDLLTEYPILKTTFGKGNTYGNTDIILPVKTITKILKENNVSEETQNKILETITENNVEFVLKHVESNDIDSEYFSEISRSVNPDNATFAEKLYTAEDFPKEYISDIIKHIHSGNEAFAEKLCFDKDFPKELVSDIILGTGSAKSNIRFSEKLCFDKNFPKEHIASIVRATTGENMALAEKLCADKEFPKELIEDCISGVTSKEIGTVEKLIDSKDIKPQHIPDFITYMANTDAKIEEVEKATNTKEMRVWTDKNLENGLDVESIVNLARTQKKLFTETNNAKLSEEAKVKKAAARELQQQKMKDAASIQADPQALDTITKTLVELGIPESMAKNAYAKLCIDSNGKVDKMKLDAMSALIKTFGVERTINDKGKEKINVKISPKDISDIFKFTTANEMSNENGVFRAQMIRDIIIMKNSGIDDIKLATNIACVKNMSLVEMKARLKGDLRKDLNQRIEQLPDNIKEKVKAQSIDLDNIKEKALAEPKIIEDREIVQVPSQTVKLRQLDAIVGTERLVLDKFKTDPEVSQIWSDEAAFKRWAEKRLEKICNWEENDYKSTKYPHYNEARKRGLQNWTEFLNSDDCSVKDDVFAKLLFMDGIVAEMKPDNAYTPPAISQEGFETVYNQILEGNTKVSVTRAYAEINRNKAIQQFGEKTVASDGTEGTWVRIPTGGKRGEPEYDEHIAMIQALAEGSAWCLRFENAHNYLAKGDIYFFVDKNGKAQMAINVTPEGKINEMQRRDQQDGTVPVHLANVVNEWAQKNHFTGREQQIKTALEAKPVFDAQKAKFSALQQKDDVIGIFRSLGINVTELSDGTLSIGSYRATIYNKPYTLFDLGISEDFIMSNVSEISGNVDLKNSMLTKAKKLKHVNGTINFGDNKISDLRALETVNGKKIEWIKPEN